MPKPDKSVIRRKVRREMNIIKNMYFNDNSRDNSNKSNETNSDNITQTTENNQHPSAANISSVSQITNIKQNMILKTVSPNVLPLHHLHNELSQETLIPMDNNDFKTDLSNWAVNCNVPQTTVNELLKIMKCYEVIKTDNIPRDCRTLLAQPQSTIGIIRNVTPGYYYHFGLKNGIMKYVSTKLTEINIAIGVDGLPLTKSSNSQFWPILACILGTNNIVFPIGVYHGYAKPNCSDDFLADFILEAKTLMTEGIILNGCIIKVSIQIFICDAPAKSFLLNTKGHSGFNSCSRCIEEGEYYERRVCFPYSKNKPAKKTHIDYVNMKYEEYHIGKTSIITELPGLDIVRAFPLDYMHLVCLGVVRKLIMLWLHKGPVQTRLPSRSVHALTASLLNLKPFIPSEFARKTRHVQDVSRWKATELRLFLIYIGPIVLKNIVNHNIFTNFMSLYISMLILLSPDYQCYVNYAESLLDYFVRTFEEIYGRQHVSHNIHGLLHLVDDYKIYGPLDNCSAFPFENYMKSLKSRIRKHDKPLEQLIKRYNEIYNNKNKINVQENSKNVILLKLHHNGPLIHNIIEGLQYYKLIKNKIKINTKIDRERYILTTSGEIVKVFNIVQTQGQNNKIMIIGRSFETKTALYEKPVDSTIFNIFVVNNLSEQLRCWEDCEIHKKLLFLKHSGNLIVMPIIHT